MTTTLPTRMTIAEALERLMKNGMPFGFHAYDGSSAGPVDASFTVRLLNQRGLAYQLTAPADLGFARAYVTGDLEVDGVSPRKPYDARQFILNNFDIRVPSPTELLCYVRILGLNNLNPLEARPDETNPNQRHN